MRWLTRRRGSRRKSSSIHKRRVCLGNPYLLKVLHLQRTIEQSDGTHQTSKADLHSGDYKGNSWEDLFSIEAEEERMSRLVRINVIGSFLTQQYSWAIPSAKALRILSHFAPLVEIGSGSGYWARLLLDRGVDILPVDRTGTRASSSWTEVLQGGPGILPRLSSKRNLFLCYPDETSQLGSACLRRFKGEYLIHVGELFITGTQSGGLQRPWGRSSSADFQVELMETFHLLLVTRLPSFPVARDHLTVWRRTSFVKGQNYAKDRDDVWAAIPGEERIDFNASASSLRHLLY